MDVNLTNALSLPSAEHLLGTDRLGRDVLSRLLWGGRVSLGGLAEALAIALILGIALGLLAGYFGGLVDNTVSRVTEICMATPAIVVMLMIYGISDNNSHLGMITLGVLTSPNITRVTRTAARAVREETYIASARVLGLGRLRIIFDHVLPNVWGPIIVNAAVLAAIILGVQGGLNYINLGVNPPEPSWGGMVADAQKVLSKQPYLMLPGGMTLTLVIMSLLLVADGLRDAMALGRERFEPHEGIAAQPATRSEPANPANPATALSVRGLSASIRGLELVRNVSFDLADGETLGIVGESGCGKSVTASAILGQLGDGFAIDGEVHFGQVELNSAPRGVRASSRGSGIAYVSQDPMVALDPCFRVESQLGELVGRHDKLRGRMRRARVLELLTQVGLPDPKDTAARFPHQLSGGMMQRVAIACALAGRPRVLIADEPTTALDVTIQGEILDLLRRLAAESGTSIILITHDLGVVADICDKVAVMYAGEVVEVAEVADLFMHPAHPYTRAMLSSNPTAAVPGAKLPTIPGMVPAPSQWPRGCHFHDRCASGLNACTLDAIPLSDVIGSDGHEVRCIRADELAVASNSEEAGHD
ncbi:dipeptide/oligopeptide/nickel ABC transporter permease/ATP-binding protein [Martelella soudanensis]|uniref:dipeptide/oligopeptide/nickel ABC transporter permease/ATP-binding protein n=1 Tax=unclassified Martelella TaxID=2629616 RepID=UPI0015DF140B|nr:MULTISPECIES: dipeptide/oligopeptide/nickel ABC transporter permease/ATP-binding protein [unclassified Martelella]